MTCLEDFDRLGLAPLDVGNFGWAVDELSSGFLPPGFMWTITLAAVVGGHMGTWAGHVVARDLVVARGERYDVRREGHRP